MAGNGSRRRAGQQRFGAHVSTAGGLYKAFSRAEELGCEVMQVFTRNQRQWTPPALTDEAVSQWHQAREQSTVEAVAAHASYLINLASPEKDVWNRSIEALSDELVRCDRLSIPSLVVHPGSHMGAGIDAGIRRIVRALNRVHRTVSKTPARIALESTAGQGTSVGSRIEHLGGIVAQCKEPQRLAVCLDTCHLFAAGYDLSTGEGYDRLISELTDHLPETPVVALHLNDSIKPCGSHVDRHAHIGKGEIGRKAFARIVTDRRFRKVPMLLETPKGQDARGREFDRANLSVLRRLASDKRNARLSS